MTDEQTKAVKALRDACELVLQEYKDLYSDPSNYYHCPYPDCVAQATEAIKEVERWIV